jgi:hypothetical protein
MRRARIAFVGAVVGLFGLELPCPANAEEINGLSETVREQGLVIQELREELGRVRGEQERAEDRVRALEDQMADGAGDSVSAEYVDRRIEAFEASDESRLLLSGYGTAQYVDAKNGASTFLGNFNPIFHFSLSDRLHFHGELEILLTKFAPATEIGLEFATIDYLVNDWLTFSAGQFLVPFNVFGPKIHPQWINRLASPPPIYGAHGDDHGGGGGIIPVLTDVGVMASGGTTLWGEDAKLNYAFYAINGPEVHEPEEPELDFHTPDDNDNKATGGRFGFLPIPNLEVGVSYLTGRTKGPGGRFDLLGADAWHRFGGLELRGEYMRLERDAGDAQPDVWGYYLQGAYRLAGGFLGLPALDGVLGRFEPVVRWGEVEGFKEKDREQLAFGLNYWLAPSVPFKFTYELNSGTVKDDRAIFQLAYGF